MTYRDRLIKVWSYRDWEIKVWSKVHLDRASLVKGDSGKVLPFVHVLIRYPLTHPILIELYLKYDINNTR